MKPQEGVRYTLTLREASGAAARYYAVVETPTGEGSAVVAIDGPSAVFEGTPENLESAHQVQLLALARALGRRADEGFPRRVHRWRSPGVR
ncbi:MAG: hypothetical protein HY909_25285 [Deltaproteobacteria bacterium]|nr:hypothetical protein [Deltaproteobacteria bacterium]